MDMSNVSLTTILSGITLISTLGGAAGYFGKSRGDSIIKYQANEIQLRDATISRLNKEATAKDEQIKAKDQQIAEIKDHNKYLQKLAQGSPQLVKLTKEIKRLADIVSKK